MNNFGCVRPYLTYKGFRLLIHAQENWHGGTGVERRKKNKREGVSPLAAVRRARTESPRRSSGKLRVVENARNEDPAIRARLCTISRRETRHCSDEWNRGSGSDHVGSGDWAGR